MRVAHLVIGPDRHGVVQFALRIRACVLTAGLDAPLIRHESAADVGPLPEVDAVHLHVTDRLFGSSADAAAATVEDVAAAVHSSGAALIVTLHDLPQPSDGRSAAARIDCYRRVVACADVVVVSSEHERALLADAGIDASPEVVPLPATTGRGRRPIRIADEVTVGVLGFLYPGKGHAEVLNALPSGARLMALGTPSPGHQHLVDELDSAAEANGSVVEITGYIDDADLPDLLGRVTIPVAHHLHMSASGSINTWIEHGRRPLVVAGAYTRELDRRSPGTVTVYEEDRLADALAHAAEHPETTWLAEGVQANPTPTEVGAMHAAIYRALHA
ncbi:MAG: hypothetical protein WBA00_03035 [Rhodococcus sp. (in: high G+C Gram-positive bacteria)]